jgi:alpha-mannosidase
MTILRSSQYPYMLRRAFELPFDERKAETEVADQGEHDISYAIYPHAFDFTKAQTVKKAYEFNYPLLPLVVPAHIGKLPKSKSFISIQPENVILTTMKKAEDSDDMILRFYENAGKETRVIIKLAEAPTGAKETDLMENMKSELPIDDIGIHANVQKHEIKTLNLTFP